MSGILKRGAAALLMLALLLALLPLGARADGAVHLSPKSTDIPYPVTGGNIYFDAETGSIRTSDESVTEVDIPEEINGVKVTAIGDFSFGGTDITKITIPDSVVSIGNQVFDRCTHLKSVIILGGVISIGDTAFFSCSNLSIIYLPDSLTSIGSGAFFGCDSLRDVYYSGSEKDWAAVSISNENTALDNAAIHFNSDLSQLPVVKWTLADDGVLTIEGRGAISRSPWAEDLSQIISVVIHPGITDIGDYAFELCFNLANISIPEGITSIGDGAFYYCHSLTSVTIPDSVTSIGEKAFTDCDSLTGIMIPDGVTSIGSDAFKWCSGLTSISIPVGVTSIGKRTFFNCKSLTNISIPLGVTSIGDDAFTFCENLTSITIPASITEIGNGTFEGCDSLTDIYYSGSEAEWKAISIGDSNDPLLNATIHYNSPMPEGAAPATAPAEESAPAAPAEEPAAVSEKPVVQVSTQKVAVDGVEKVIDHYNIDGDNYFKLRDLACILMGTDYAFDVGYDAATRTIAVTTGGVYTPLDTDMLVGADMSDTAVVSTQALTVDGASVSLTAFNIDGSNYFRLRDLAPYIGFGVDYDAATRTALIITK